ncbi:MAG: hypothetical protein KGI38_04940 [Thaumarchaeota archaeon]|nr:hypothetical protein [Nitrososphaerota archaeon]
MNYPAFDNPDFAYESGVHMGDGSLSGGLSADYRYVISGNKKKETQYYVEVLVPLIKDLYCISPTIAFQNNSVYLRVYSKELVLFKHRELGFPIGPKRGLRIPSFAISSRQSTANALSGLYDTDGSVKIRHDKSGEYPRISFSQKDDGPIRQTKTLLRSFGISSTMYRCESFDARSGKVYTQWCLDINGFENFDIFVNKIGTRSPYVRERMQAVEAVR